MALLSLAESRAVRSREEDGAEGIRERKEEVELARRWKGSRYSVKSSKEKVSQSEL